MKITISSDILENNKLSLGEFLILMLFEYKIDSKAHIPDLLKRGLLSSSYDITTMKVNGNFITHKGSEMLNTIILDSDKVQEPPDRLEYLATELKRIFPQGRKDGTGLYWSDGIPIIIKRLKTFFKKYGHDYNDEQILNAAIRYVDSFRGQYKYMQLLKYFIFKDKHGAENVENESALLTFMEHEGEEIDKRDDWTSNLK